MSIGATLQKHLPSWHIVYEVVSHSPTMASVLSAEACCLSPDRVAKGVVVRIGDRYVLAVLSASRRISRADLKMELGENFSLASENELEQLFEDCVPAAAPPVGEAYGLDGVVEPSICDQPDGLFRAPRPRDSRPRDSNPVRQADRRRGARAPPLAGERDGRNARRNAGG
jgi:Ala-tRNA(Pro) deacylase